MWELYDALIGGIPGDVTVEAHNSGCAWTLVRGGGSTGLAMTVRVCNRPCLHAGPVVGQPLKRIAELVKSWNFLEAALGAAAINAWYNAPGRVTALTGFVGEDPQDMSMESRKKQDAFTAYAREAAGKKVAVIGHFPHIETQLGPVCALSILERNPIGEDYPDSACEYILPEQDYVFITGVTLVNKTLPRLLALARPGARVVLVGPSVPLAPVLFDFGVYDLSGFCVTEQDRMDELVRLGGLMSVFGAGRMVRVLRETREGETAGVQAV